MEKNLRGKIDSLIISKQQILLSFCACAPKGANSLCTGKSCVGVYMYAGMPNSLPHVCAGMHECMPVCIHSRVRVCIYYLTLLLTRF